MVHFIALFRLAKGVGDADLEDMIRKSRLCLHRLNEAHNLRSGRSIDRKGEFGFFLSADFESREKLAMFRDDPAYRRFEQEVLEGRVAERVEHLFETEVGKDPKYS